MFSTSLSQLTYIYMLANHKFAMVSLAPNLSYINLSYIEHLIKTLDEAQLLNEQNINAIIHAGVTNFTPVRDALLNLYSIRCLDQISYNFVLQNFDQISDIVSMLEGLRSLHSFFDQKKLRMLFALDDMCLCIIRVMSTMQSARILNNNNFEVMVMHAKLMQRDAARNNMSDIFAVLHQADLLTQQNFDAMKVCFPLDLNPLRTAIDFLLKEHLLNQDNLNLILETPESALRIARTIRLTFYPKALQQLLELGGYSGFWRFFGWSCRDEKNVESLDLKNSLTLAKSANFMRDLAGAFEIYRNNIVEFDENTCVGKSINCSVCTVTDNTAAISLNCGHSFHLSCMENGVKSYIYQGSLQKALTCMHQDCNCVVTPLQLAKVISNVDDVVKFQRMFIRATAEIKMCPLCPNGVEICDKDIPAHCNTCGKSNCFECGEIKHSYFTCEQAKSLDKTLLQEFLFYKQLVMQKRDGNFGKCPHCRTLLEKNGGCGDMICGRDYHESYKIKGLCGNKFKWHERITVQSEISKIEKSLQHRL